MKNKYRILALTTALVMLILALPVTAGAIMDSGKWNKAHTKYYYNGKVFKGYFIDYDEQKCYYLSPNIQKNKILTLPGKIVVLTKGLPTTDQTAFGEMTWTLIGWSKDKITIQTDSKGAIKTNGLTWAKKGSSKYLFRNGIALSNAIAKVKGKIYLFDNVGKMRTGWVTVNTTMETYMYEYKQQKNKTVKETKLSDTPVNGTMYFAKSTGKAYTGHKKIGTKYYYFDKNGILQTQVE